MPDPATLDTEGDDDVVRHAWVLVNSTADQGT